MTWKAEACLTLDHLIIYDCWGSETPAQVSLIACPPFFSQHNAFLCSYLQCDPLNLRCNLHD